MDIENVLVRRVNILDIEDMNNLKEVAEADGKFYDYILVDKLAWKPDIVEESESITIYKIRKILQQHQENMMELIENYEKIKEFDRIANELEDVLHHINVEEEKQPEKKKTCCSIGKLGKLCLCDKILYKIRPYTFEIIRAI